MQFIFLFFTSFTTTSTNLLLYKPNRQNSRLTKCECISRGNLCTWESVDYRMQERIIKNYFEQEIDAEQRCDVFCIEGVPAACMIYKNTNCKGDPIVDSFFLNKSLLFLFDAGHSMRKLLYDRYRHIDIQHAQKRNDFLMF